MGDRMRRTEALRELEPVLEPGERVSWSGKPVAGQLLVRKIATTIVGLGIVAAVGYFSLRAWLPRLGVDSADIGSLLAGLSGNRDLLVPVLVVAAMPFLYIANLLYENSRWQRTAYAVTDRRLLSVLGPKGKVLWSLGPEKVAFVHVHRMGAGTGDVAFNGRAPGSGTRQRRRLYTFQRVPDPERVAAQVRSWREEREREAVEGGRDRRRIAFPALGFALDVPAGWREGGSSDDGSGAFQVLSDRSPLGVDTTGSERLLELHGPFGASLVLDAAPGGRWSFEEARAVGGGILRLPDVVEEHAELVVGVTPGFSVTYELRVEQPLRRGYTTTASVPVRVRTIVLEHRDLQLRFTLGWMTGFDSMRTTLEEVVETFEPTEISAPGPSS